MEWLFCKEMKIEIKKEHRKYLLSIFLKKRPKLRVVFSILTTVLRNLSESPDFLKINRLLEVISLNFGREISQSLIIIDNLGILIKTKNGILENISSIDIPEYIFSINDLKILRENLEKKFGLIHIMIFISSVSIYNIIERVNQKDVIHPLNLIIISAFQQINNHNIIIHPLPHTFKIFLSLNIEEILYKFSEIFGIPYYNKDSVFKMPYFLLKFFLKNYLFF